MKLHFHARILLSVTLLAALSGIAFASESPTPETPPKGIAKSDWHSIRAAYEADRHAFHAVDGRWQARNPGQQWRTEFDGKGFTVTPDHGQWIWGLELTGYGERTLLSATSSITHEGGKISCQRDENLTEWFINDTRGLEQGWTIHSRSMGVSPTSSHLTLTLDVRGDLQPRVFTAFFQDNAGNSGLSSPVTLRFIDPSALNTYYSFQTAWLDGSGDFTADPFNTGISNGLAWALGMNPRNPDRSRLPTHLVEGEDGNQFFVYRARVLASEVAYQILSSDSLDAGSWSPLPPAQRAETLEVGGWRLIEARVPITEVAPVRFVQLSVQNP